MKKLSLFLAFLIAYGNLIANDGEYAVSKIPPALLKNSHVIKRMEEIRFEISSLSKTRYYQKFALTILDENGDDYAVLLRRYDKIRSVESIEGRLYDAYGKKIKTLKKGDIEDRSDVADGSLMDDARIKVHSFYYKVYPFTVEYEVEMSISSTYNLPPWVPQPDENYAVSESSFSIECPGDFTFRYKMFNYQGEPTISQEKNDKIYQWHLSNLPAYKEEYGSPNWRTMTTCVFFSPDRFKIDDYAGDMSSWENFGKFIYQLNAGRDALPDNIKEQVHRLADGITDTRQKVKVLYEFMQKNTRYISVQLGIGGLQPYDATYVATKSYGDCKALANYMYSLLKEAHIHSNYTLVKSGRNEKYFLPDFPSDQFDHIILCVPLPKDTMWLECTDQTIPAGYLGSFTSDRYALAVTEDGGRLVRTPKYPMAENLQARKIKAILESDGTLNTIIATSYRGLQQDGVSGLINNFSNDKVKEALNEELDFGTYDVNKFAYKQIKSGSPGIDESLDVSVSNYATITGKRLFIIPNVMNRSHAKLRLDEERKFDIELKNEFHDVDSVEIEIPKGYTPEALPEPVSVETRFGKYSCSVELAGDKMFYHRNWEQYSGTFPAKDYPDLVKYFDTIYKADRNKVVLIKKD